jgi:hypothetical protein
MNTEDFLLYIEELFEFAKVNRLAFNPTQDVFNKITKSYNNDKKCTCDDKRKCPCKEVIKEIEIKGTCLCWLFCSYKHGDDYLHRHHYIDSNNSVLNDIDRKELIKKDKDSKKQK